MLHVLCVAILCIYVGSARACGHAQRRCRSCARRRERLCRRRQRPMAHGRSSPQRRTVALGHCRRNTARAASRMPMRQASFLAPSTWRIKTFRPISRASLSTCRAACGMRLGIRRAIMTKVATRRVRMPRALLLSSAGMAALIGLTPHRWTA